jgi:hypothetical protein
MPTVTDDGDGPEERATTEEGTKAPEEVTPYMVFDTVGESYKFAVDYWYGRNPGTWTFATAQPWHSSKVKRLEQSLATSSSRPTEEKQIAALLNATSVMTEIAQNLRDDLTGARAAERKAFVVGVLGVVVAVLALIPPVVELLT